MVTNSLQGIGDLVAIDHGKCIKVYVTGEYSRIFRDYFRWFDFVYSLVLCQTSKIKMSLRGKASVKHAYFACRMPTVAILL